MILGYVQQAAINAKYKAGSVIRLNQPCAVFGLPWVHFVSLWEFALRDGGFLLLPQAGNNLVPPYSGAPPAVRTNSCPLFRGRKGALPVAEQATAAAGQPLAFARARRRANA